MPSSALDVYEKRLPPLIASIPLEANRAALLQYLNEKRADGIKPGTLLNDAHAITDLAIHLGAKTFKEASKDDITAFANITTKQTRVPFGNGTKTVQFKASTQARRKQSIRQFYKHISGGEEYPAQVRRLRARRPLNDAIATDMLITAEDLRRLLQAHPDKRDKAILAVLYESGLRAAEFCALNVDSLQLDEFGAVLTLPKNAPGLKTGARRIRLYYNDSVPYLQSWFEDHPLKDQPRAPLFYGRSRRAPGARMTAHGLYEFIRGAGRRANLKRRLHPHLFRHTAATERARMGWTEAQMRAFFGWSRSSDMPATYVHLAGKDYEEMDLERRGLKAKGKTTRRGLAPIACRACKSENLPTAYFCQSCRSPITPKAEQQLAQKQNEALAQIIRDEMDRRGLKQIGFTANMGDKEK